MALWTYSEQQTIKPIDANQPETLFDELSEEVQSVELRQLLGEEFYNDLIANPGNYDDLLDGTTYVVDEVTYTVKGLKYMLAYFFYAAYMGQSGVVDTFSGMVHHNYDDSQRISNAQLKNLQAHYRQVAQSYWKECYNLMCENSEDYDYFYATRKKRVKYKTL